MDYFIIGLGNPGRTYTRTRHNVGWIILMEQHPLGWEHDKYLEAEYFSREVNDYLLHYLLPQTYMNKSGLTIAGLKKTFSSFSAERLIVIHDDVDLPLGTVRVSFSKGSGGHNGIKSIIQHLGSQSFVRIRVGIAKTLDDGRIVKPPVLGVFEDSEYHTVIHDVAPHVQKVLKDIVTHGYERAMNSHNGK